MHMILEYIKNNGAIKKAAGSFKIVRQDCNCHIGNDNFSHSFLYKRTLPCPYYVSYFNVTFIKQEESCNLLVFVKTNPRDMKVPVVEETPIWLKRVISS